jgi:hypothetical protein
MEFSTCGAMVVLKEFWTLECFRFLILGLGMFNLYYFFLSNMSLEKVFLGHPLPLPSSILLRGHTQITVYSLLLKFVHQGSRASCFVPYCIARI